MNGSLHDVQQAGIGLMMLSSKVCMSYSWQSNGKMLPHARCES